jgi:hypothetical protein
MKEMRKGEGNSRAKVVINLETGILYGCIKDAADAHGLNKGTVQHGLRMHKIYKQFMLL